VKARRVSVSIVSRLWWLPIVAAGSLTDRGSRVRWLCAPAVVGLTAFASNAGKLTIRRPRPSAGYGAPPVGRLGLASSFPSTHAACAFAIAGWMSRSRQRNWLHLLAATVGYARVRRRAHYLSDVLAGGILGYAIGRCADWVWEIRVGVVRALRNGRKAISECPEVQLEPTVRKGMVRMRRVRVAVIAAVVASVLLGGSALRAWASPPLSQEGALYAKVRQVCPPPQPGDATCFALALVPAPASAEDARSYQASAGSSSTGPAGGLTPADLASAYGFLPSVGGAGQTVAIVDPYDDPDIEEDLGTFDSHYGLAACTDANGCFKKVSQTGSTTSLPPADTTGWSLEISLDVETVHSVCESCKILLVEASSESLANLAAAVDEAVELGATEVSNSYGAPESQMGETEQTAYDHPEVVIVASAGDSGYLNWDYVADFLKAPEMPNAPASLPDVVAVGGTSLELKTNGTRKSESVWNDSGRPSHKEFKRFSATGGGCSTLFTAPSWQQSAPGWTNTACGIGRLDNDISAVADPYTGFDVYDSYVYEPEFTPGWMTVGGTSLSSPLITALYGLAGGSHGVSFPAATLYTHLGEASALYDVTTGGNGYCDGEEAASCGEPGINKEFGEIDCEGTTSCDAAPGFDGPSGVGTPNGLGAFNSLSRSKPTVVTQAASSIRARSALLNATVNPNGQAVGTCTFEYGPTASYGDSAPCARLPGSGTSPVAVSARIRALTPKSTYHYRITATNPDGTSTGKRKTLKTP